MSDVFCLNFDEARHHFMPCVMYRYFFHQS